MYDEPLDGDDPTTATSLAEQLSCDAACAWRTMSRRSRILGGRNHEDVTMDDFGFVPPATIESPHPVHRPRWSRPICAYERFSVLAKPTRDDVIGAMLEDACQQAGHALIEALTRWKRPPPPLPAPGAT